MLMSYISSLINQNRELRSVGVSTATASGCTSINVVLGGWEVYASLERLVITANNNISSLTATIVSDAAAYLAASGQAKAAYILAQDTGNMANNRVEFAFNGVSVENPFQLGLLHIVLSTGSAMTTGTIFNIMAEGKKQQSFKPLDTNNNPFYGDPSFRVLRVVSGGATIELTNNGAIGQVVNPGPITWLNNDTDLLYVGSSKPLTQLFFNVFTPQPAGTTLTAQYWNGSTWASASVLDNTSDGQAAASTFSYPGVITIPAESAWVVSQIATDPLYLQIQAMLAGTQPPLTLLNCPPRYWVRFNLTTGSYPVTIGKLGQIR